MIAAARAVLGEWRDTAGAYALAPPVLTAFLYVVHATDAAGLPLQLAVNTLVTVVVGGLVAPMQHLLVLPVAKWLRLEADGPARVARLVAVGFALALGSDLSARALVALGTADQVDPVRAQIGRVGVVVAVVLIGFLAVRAGSARREERVRQEAELARLQAIQARTDPHFLYNALNTVAALIPADPARAEDAVLRLSDLFRYVLEGARRERVALREELAAVDDYLGIEALRLGDRLRVVRAIDPTTVDQPVLPLVLQPLVENAVQHGLATRSKGGTVTVRVERTGDRLDLVVEDDGPGVGVAGGAGSAQADLARRLALVYGGRAELVAGPMEGGGYRSRVSLPMEPR